MKNSLLIAIFLIPLICSSPPSRAQSGKVPPFRMVQTDGKLFRAQDLPMGKPIIILYFSTECDDCIQLIMNLLARMDEFSSASIAMITYYPLESVAEFARTHYLDNYSNIYVGTEGNTFLIRNYYNIYELPFLALYTKEGDLVRSYYEKADLDDLAERLDNL